MTNDFLRQKLARVARRYRWLGLWRKLGCVWLGAALAAAALHWVQTQVGWTSPQTLPVLALAVAGVALGIALRHLSRRPDLRAVARKIETAHPELNGVLLTAVQQERPTGYLQERVLHEAVARSQQRDWRQVVPAWQLGWVHTLHALALIGCIAAVMRLQNPPPTAGAATGVVSGGVEVTPGDASIERGESLVVLARFGRAVPASVNLVMSASGAAPRTIPLVKSLADPVFGGSVPEVTAHFTYRIEAPGLRTREFKVNVYEHPRLVRADVDLRYPDYTKLAPQRIEDTRRISAVEGTRLALTLQLNKPVTSARLVARDEQQTVLTLAAAPNQPVATLAGFVPKQSETYDLELVDADGRESKVPANFVFAVQPNRAPEIRLTAPRGDMRPSALEEIAFAGTVWDDFGSTVYGLSYSVGGAALRSIELGRNLPAKETREFATMLKLEELGAKPNDLIAWHVWAEDVSPKGKPRRTKGDLFFAEVRPFDEIYRESQGMESPDEVFAQDQGNESRRLSELQKDIVNATWKLQRDGAKPEYAEDVKVVGESQRTVLLRANDAQAKSRTPEDKELWQGAVREMEKALEHLEQAAKGPGPLAQALPAEQAAYQALLKLNAHDIAVTRSRRRGQGGNPEANQRQIEQLELQQSETRYETQRQARAPQSAERREQLAVTNRLQELARRQEDWNERMKELQTALQEAKSEQEREEVRRRLKRLQEEQRQMLADLDEVRQRMDRPENQSRMSQDREQLDRTREDLQRAAESAGEGSVAQALASGTRAQRQLQQLRDDMRQRNSSEFVDELREMRQDARELAGQQEQISRQLETLAQGSAQRRTLSDGGANQELLDALERQKARMQDLVQRATRVSEQAETIEPLLSRQLYDSIRKSTQDDANSVKEARNDLVASGQLTFDLRERLEAAAGREGGGKALEVARELLREGAVAEAGRVGQRARAEIDELRRGVERAAESVLGDEAEQLRLAQSELDALTRQLEREIAQAGQSSQESAGGESKERAAGRADPTRKAGGDEARANERVAGNKPGAETTRGRAGERSGRDGGEGGRNEFPFDDLIAGAGSREAEPQRWGEGWMSGSEIDGRPLTGEAFRRWDERLREVEGLLETPELRNAVATARERARMLRRELKQEFKKPDWAVVQLEILRPLVEVRGRVAEELARRETPDSLAPIDRDPVPPRYVEPVRRYYEELGKDQ